MTATDGDGKTRPQPSPVTDPGEWLTPSVSYIDPARRFCELCGRPIARRFWRVLTNGREGVFCDPAHAALYTTYPRSSDDGK